MKVKYIRPFIDAVNDFFSMMLGQQVTAGTLGLREQESATYEITSLIGLSGTAKGSVAMSFPTNTAIELTNKLLGTEDNKELNKSVTDAVSETSNIVAGSAKAKFIVGDGTPIDLSLPNVVIGKNYVISYPSNVTWIEVPFTSDLGEFSMRVTFDMDENKIKIR